MMRLLGEALHRFEEIRGQRELVTKVLIKTNQDFDEESEYDDDADNDEDTDDDDHVDKGGFDRGDC